MRGLAAAALLVSWALPVPAQRGELVIEERHDIASAKGQDEISGIAKSRQLPGLWWVHNDSGDGPMLYPLDDRGATIQPLRRKRNDKHGGLELVAAANIDWEDIALADGLIYVADMGNNDNARRDLGVYVVAEPNPFYTERVRPLRFLPVAYPDQEAWPSARWHYDCESLFVSDGNLYFVTKRRESGRRSRLAPGATLYRLSLEEASPTGVNPLVKVDERDDLYAPTAADLSPDGQRLAVLTVARLWILQRPGSGDAWLSGDRDAELSVPLPGGAARLAEAVCWDDDRTLRIVTEDTRAFFTVKVGSAP